MAINNPMIIISFLKLEESVKRLWSLGGAPELLCSFICIVMILEQNAAYLIFYGGVPPCLLIYLGILRQVVWNWPLTHTINLRSNYAGQR